MSRNFHVIAPSHVSRKMIIPQSCWNIQLIPCSLALTDDFQSIHSLWQY